MQYKGAICVFLFHLGAIRSLDHKLQEIAENGCFVTRQNDSARHENFAIPGAS